MVHRDWTARVLRLARLRQSWARDDAAVGCGPGIACRPESAGPRDTLLPIRKGESRESCTSTLRFPQLRFCSWRPRAWRRLARGSRYPIVEKVVKTSPEQELTIQLNTGGTLRIRGVDGDAVRLRARLPRKSWRNFVVTLEASAGGVLLHSSAVDGSVPAAGLILSSWCPTATVCPSNRPVDASISPASKGRSAAYLGGMITIIHAQDTPKSPRPAAPFVFLIRI